MKKKFFLMWGGCIFIIALMIYVSYMWKDACNNWYFNGAHCFFLENRLQDIKNVSIYVFREEFIFRLIPILIASIIISLSKPKWLKYVLYLMFTVIIICTQLQFGALHYNIIADTSYERPIIIHGIMGLILTIVYVSTLILVLKTLYKDKNSIKNIIIANTTAYFASVIVHASSNILVVITQTS